MIQFLVDSGGAFGIREYLASWGLELESHIRVHRYHETFRTAVVEPGTYVFSALDQLCPAELALAASLRRALAAAGQPTLNDPGRTLHRHDLLQRAYARGINAFRAFRVSDLPSSIRYPVFVRLEHEHTGSLTDLLDGRAALDAALRRLRRRGYRHAELLVTEFCDTSGSDGLYRKYSAFIVGERVIPRAMSFSRHWAAKAGGMSWNRELADEEHSFMESNRHADALLRIFELAGVRYGRIDYGILNGDVQVWEINLNPTIAPRLHAPADPLTETLRRPSKELFFNAFSRAILELGDTASAANEPIPIQYDPRLQRRAQLERARYLAARWPREVAIRLSRGRFAVVLRRLESAFLEGRGRT